MAIDPKNHGRQLKHNWFIKNKLTWGNEYFVLKIIISVSIIQTIVQYAIIYIFYYFIDDIIDPIIGEIVTNVLFTINFGFPMIPGMYLFVKIFANKEIGNEEDYLGIGKELFAEMLFTLSIVIIATSIRLILIFYSPFWFDNGRYLYYLFNVATFIYLVGIYPKTLFEKGAKSNSKYCKWCNCKYCPIRSNMHTTQQVEQYQNTSNKSTPLLSMAATATIPHHGIHSPDQSGSVLSISSVFSIANKTSRSSNTNTNINSTRIGWKKIISTYDGYEALMNYLAKEFAMENLLFLQEYIQIKNVLKKYFGEIMNQLNKSNVYTKYKLKLPETNSNMNSIHYFPQSIIAQRLNNSLEKFLVDDIDIKDDKFDNSKTLIVCKHIILAFKSIYYKYIDDSDAIFMINVSSPSRNKVTKLLDADYYLDHQQDQSDIISPSIDFEENSKNDNINSNYNFNVRRSISKRFTSLSNTLNRFWKQTEKQIESAIYNTSMIDTQLKVLSTSFKVDWTVDLDHGSKSHDDDQNSNNKIYTKLEWQNAVYTWLLEQLISTMEPNVYEISSLINDSFSRFRNKQATVYQSLCNKLEM